MSNRAPKFWTSLFKRFCNDNFYEELQGDLEEKFYEHLELYGIKKARNLYRIEVLKMIRPSVFRKPQKIQKLIMFSLISMNFKLAMRNMVRHKVFSAINIFGLAAALSVSLFMVNILYTGYNFDRQHQDIDRIHRIANYITTVKDGRQRFASMPFQAVELLKEDIPDFEAVTHIKSGFNGTFRVNGEDLLIRGIKADSAFFDIFNFKVVSGNPLAIFSDINSIVITDEIARRYFPDEDPIGQQTQEGYVVKAVLASPKKRSHLKFEIIGALEQFSQGLTVRTSREYSWANYHNNYAYFRLRESSSPEALAPKLKTLTDKVNALANFQNFEYDFISQPVEGLIFGDPGFNEPGFMIGKEGLATYLVLISVMLFIASFNYTNLSIARAIQRTKEIGIRKVSGSSNWQIIGQIICETLVMSLFSLLIGLVIYKAFSDDFIALIPSIASAFDPDLSIDIILLFVLFTTLAGLIAGIFPALFFSKIDPLALFNSRIKNKKLSFLGMRKVLVTFQLTLSMFCIMFMILMQKQISLLKSSPKGFDTENRLIVRTSEETAPLLKSAFLQVSGVAAVTITSSVPGEMGSAGISFYDPIDNDTSLIVMASWADEAFEEVLNPKLLEGRFFNPEIVEGTQKEVLVNEKFLSLIKTDLEDAVGMVLNSKRNTFKIVGVLDGMVGTNPFMGSEQPFMIMAGKSQKSQSVLMLKTVPEGMSNTMTGLEVAWKELHPDDRFKPELLETYLHKPIAEFENMIKVFRFIAFAIIVISLLGQLGMALYNAETRVKEIGIRKVLGAHMQSIIRLLLKGTIVPICIASIVAGPIVYLLFVNVLAATFKTPLAPNLWLFVQGILLLGSIILLVVVTQTWRVARLNPAESLRSE